MSLSFEDMVEVIREGEGRRLNSTLRLKWLRCARDERFRGAYLMLKTIERKEPLMTTTKERSRDLRSLADFIMCWDPDAQ